MAEWVPVFTDIFLHKKTRLVAKKCGMTTDEVWPRLVYLWVHALRYYPDGNVSDMEVNYEELSEAIKLPEKKSIVFFNALIDSGYLERDGERLLIHDWFTQGAGRLVIKREKDREKVNRFRNQLRNRYSNGYSNGYSNQDVTVTVTEKGGLQLPPCNGVNSNSNINKEKKLKEKKSQQQPTPDPGTLESAIANPDDYSDDQLGNILHHAYSETIRGGGQFDTIRRIIANLEGGADFRDMAKAFQNYAAQIQRDGTEPKYRQAAKNFFDGAWLEYVDGAPVQPKAAGDHILAEVKRLMKTLWDFKRNGGIKKHLEELEKLTDPETVKVIMKMATNGSITRLGEMDQYQYDKQLPEMVRGAMDAE